MLSPQLTNTGLLETSQLPLVIVSLLPKEKKVSFFFCNAGLLELSLGKFRNVLLNQTNPVEAVIRNIASNVTVVIFQAHAQRSDVVISFDKVR